MEIPLIVSCICPLIPVIAWGLIAIRFWRASREPLEGAKQREEHRTIIVALAGFSLAGVAIIGTQSNPKLGRPLFDIILSFLCYLASLGVQAWKDRWWHDILGAALRDAGSTALLVFIAGISFFAVGDQFKWQPWQAWTMVVVAAIAWSLDTGCNLVFTANYLRLVDQGHKP